MKLEVVKTYILVILVGISLLLTFNIWNNQPNYESLNDRMAKYYDEDELDLGGVELPKRKIIQPNQLIFHHQGKAYGFGNLEVQQTLYQDMLTWMLYDFRTMENGTEPNENNVVEIRFPVELPMRTMVGLFTFNDEVEDIPSWSFKKMYITFDEHRLLMKVQFQSVDGQKKATAIVNNPTKYDQLWKYTTEHNQMQEYITLDGIKDKIYLPKTNSTMTTHVLKVTQIEPMKLVKTLFSNPTAVKWNSTLSLYTDGRQQMRLIQDNRGIEYIDPTERNSASKIRMGPTELINKSIEDISEHRGWTGDYNLSAIDTLNDTIRFQMHYKGYPVYHVGNLLMIEQQWHNQDLYQYRRPLFFINEEVQKEEVKMTSGKEIISYLKRNGKIDQVEGIELGYKIDDFSASVIRLVPAWFMKHNGDWKEIKISSDLNLKEVG